MSFFKFINDLYKRYQKGFYVNAERKMKDAKGAAKYIGRYLARPVIAEYRIVKYDGNTVHFLVRGLSNWKKGR